MPIPPDAQWDLGEDSIGRKVRGALDAAGITPAMAEAMSWQQLRDVPYLTTGGRARIAARLEHMRTNARRAAAADPATAAATMRRAAAAMRETADGVTTVWHDWTIEAPLNDFQWTIHDERGTFIAETPDYGGMELPDHIASWTPPIAHLVAALLDALAADIDAVLADHDGRLSGTAPAEWSAAHDLADAYLQRRPT